MKKMWIVALCILLCSMILSMFSGCTLGKDVVTVPLSGETATLSGVWRFHDTIGLYGYTYENFEAEQRITEIRFKVVGEFRTYDRIFWAWSDCGLYTVSHLYYREYNPNNSAPMQYCAWMTGHKSVDINGWKEESFRTIDFGTEPQTVNKEFYDWFTANASPV